MSNGPIVLHCAETVKGGIATYLRELLPYQRDHYGVGRVRLLFPASQTLELGPLEGVDLIPYADGGGRLSNTFALALAALKCLRGEAPAIVHVHSTFAGAAVRPLAAIFSPNAKLVYCPHGWAWDRPMGTATRWLTKLVERVLSWISDSIVCISKHERRAALSSGLSESKLRLVPNGVGQVAPRPEGDSSFLSEDKLRLLFVGRFDRQKGVDVFGSALHDLRDVAVGAVAGGAVLGDSDELEFPDNVVSVGWVSPGRLQCLLQNVDALIVPSRWEGFGLVAVEAMRAGVAVIASRVGGLQEIVDHGTTGFLVEPDDPKAIANIVQSVDRETLKRMGAAGRQRFLEHYTMARVHQQLLEVYEDKSGVQVA